MVNLKCIENPFTDDYLYSFECFSNEKIFYDCIEHKPINSNDVFENLGSSFYTYLLIGDHKEWIGYVLLHNIECINGYINNIEIELRKLLLNLKNIINNKKIIKEIDLLFEDLNNHKFSDTTSLSYLEEEIELLKINCINENNETSTYFSDYYLNVFTYLYNFNEYYYLDIVIGLPLNTKKEEIELKYYGFIKEVYQQVEELIKNKFNDIPIILKNKDSILYLMNNDNQKIKLLDKKGITRK